MITVQITIDDHVSSVIGVTRQSVGSYGHDPERVLRNMVAQAEAEALAAMKARAS